MLSRPGIRRVPTNATPPAHPPVLMVEPPTEALSGKILFSHSLLTLELLTWWSLKSGGLSKPNLHIEAREGGSMRRACELTGEGRRNSGTRARRRSGGEVLRRLWGMVRSITGHHRCSLVGTNAPVGGQGTTVTRLLERSPCLMCEFATTWSVLLTICTQR